MPLVTIIMLTVPLDFLTARLHPACGVVAQDYQSFPLGCLKRQSENYPVSTLSCVSPGAEPCHLHLFFHLTSPPQDEYVPIKEYEHMRLEDFTLFHPPPAFLRQQCSRLINCTVHPSLLCRKIVVV